MMTIGDPIEAKAEYLQNQHLAQVEKKLGTAASTIKMFMTHGNEAAAKQTLYTTLKLMNPQDAVSIDKGTVMALIESYRLGAAVRTAGSQMAEKMASMPEDAKFTEIKAAGKEKSSGLWGAIKCMQNEVRKFILQRGNPRATTTY